MRTIPIRKGNRNKKRSQYNRRFHRKPLSARAFGEQLARRLGQPVVVQNLPGASGAIAARKVLRAPADGHTLLVGVTSDLISTPLLAPDAGYSHRSFTPVAKLGGSPMVLAARARAEAGWPALLERARRAPGSVSIGLGGRTGLAAFAAASLMRQAHAEFLLVPYQGAAPALAGLLAGQVDLALLPLSSVLGHAQGGRVVLVVLLSGKRFPLVPDVPTLAEAGLEGASDIEIWAVLVGPPGLPARVVETLNASVRSVLEDGAFTQRRLALGERPATPMGPADVGAFLDAEHIRLRTLLPGSN